MSGRRMEDGRYGAIYAHILTKEFLVEQYCHQKQSPYKIAEQVGCSPKLVYTYLNHYKIEEIDFSGQISAEQQYGLLTTIKTIGISKNGTKIWLCKCSCGNEVQVPTSRLKSGRSKSCGCYRKRRRNHRWKGFCDISGNLVCEIRLRAKKKKMEFNLDAKFLWELLISQEHKCAISGLSLALDKNASLDRIDSTQGYIKTNVWWVHKDINKMKMDLDLEYFLNMCEIISAHRKEVYKDGNASN